MEVIYGVVEEEGIWAGEKMFCECLWMCVSFIFLANVLCYSAKQTPWANHGHSGTQAQGAALDEIYTGCEFMWNKEITLFDYAAPRSLTLISFVVWSWLLVQYYIRKSYSNLESRGSWQNDACHDLLYRLTLVQLDLTSHWSSCSLPLQLFNFYKLYIMMCRHEKLYVLKEPERQYQYQFHINISYSGQVRYWEDKM